MTNWLKKTTALMFLLAILASAAWAIHHRAKAAQLKESPVISHEAMYYTKAFGKMVHCTLCPNKCILSAGQFGRCKARQNIDGKLYSMVYGKLATWHVDPIEKKPFFHVLPGEAAFSVATTGCNLRCLFCQNWEISQASTDAIKTQPATPEEIVTQARASRAKAIAFTYTEPTIAFEYVLDIAKSAKKAGLKTLMVSNGYIEQAPLKELLPYIDAYKIDLKSFNKEFYKKLTGGQIGPVLKTMQTIHQSGVWLEIVTLLVTGENDSDEEIRALARWIKDNLGADVPLHFSRFSPNYKMRNTLPTPPATIVRARKIALEEGLHYVYTGNIAYAPGETTPCPSSGEEVIVRQAMFTIKNTLKDGACADGEKIPGIWQ